ncbi:Mss4-like protein [Cyathus striatus]|nr:Mss4-like protein [Cyathus striatus]
MSHLQKNENKDHLPDNDHTTAGLEHHEKRQVHKNQMNRPLNALMEQNKSFKAIYTGSCFCGNVQFEIARDKPLDAKFCHCPTCQRLHGAPFQWGKEDLIYWNPEDKSQEYILPCKISCRNCRTPIMDEGRNMILLFPTLVHFNNLEDKRQFYPTAHIFYSCRVVDVTDGLPKFEKHKNASALIPETLEEVPNKERNKN